MLAMLARLPQSTQDRQMDLESQRLKQGFDLEKHHIDVLASDRRDERVAKKRTELLTYIFAFVVTLLLLGLVIYLYVNNQSQFATPILTLALGAGSGWLGGNGYARAKFEKEQPE